jgi:hypothetical protein
LFTYFFLSFFLSSYIGMCISIYLSSMYLFIFCLRKYLCTYFSLSLYISSISAYLCIFPLSVYIYFFYLSILHLSPTLSPSSYCFANARNWNLKMLHKVSDGKLGFYLKPLSSVSTCVVLSTYSPFSLLLNHT